MRTRLSQLCLILILGIGLVLRLPLLNGSFWLDEAAQALESVRPLSQQLQIVDDFQPPLIHLMVHFLLDFSHQEWWLRLGAALIPGLVTIWATYEFGKKLFSPWVAALAALFLATSSFHIFYSQELRPYSLPTMFGAVSCLLIAGWLKQSATKASLDSQSNLNWRSTEGFLFIGMSILGWYSSYLYPFLFFTQIIFLWLCVPKYRKQALITAAITMAAFLPWLPMFFAQLHAGQSLRTALPGWEQVVSFDQFKSIALTGGKFLFGVTDLGVNKIFILLCVVSLCLFLPLGLKLLHTLMTDQSQREREGKKILFILLWLCLPILLIWIVSFVVPVLQPKRVLFSLPAFYLLLAYLIVYPLQSIFAKNGQQLKAKLSIIKLQIYTASILAIFFLLTVNMVVTLQYYVLPKYQREDWRGIHQQILTQYPHDTVVIFAFPEAFAPWRWYDDGKYPVITTGILTTSNVTTIDPLKKATDYQTVLVFDYLRDLTDPRHKIDAQLKEYGYIEVNQITPKTELGIIHVYEKKDHTIG